MPVTEASPCLSKGSVSSWRVGQVRCPTVEERGTQMALKEPLKKGFILGKGRGERGGNPCTRGEGKPAERCKAWL